MRENKLVSTEHNFDQIEHVLLTESRFRVSPKFPYQFFLSALGKSRKE
jgi:hypothetical protein